MGRAALALGAVLILGGGGALGYALTRKAKAAWTPEASAAMESAVAELDSAITKARSELRGSADALAGLPRLKSAVVGDAATAMDLVTQGEFKVSLKPGEVVELGQRADGKATTLVVQPANGSHNNHAGEPGSYADFTATSFSITEVVEVVPLYESKVTGYIAASRIVDLAPLIAKLEAAKINGRLEHIQTKQSRTIGQPVAGAKTEVRPLVQQKAFQIVVDAPAMKAAIPTALVGAGAGAAGLGLVLVILGLLRKPQHVPQGKSFQSMETVPSGPYVAKNAETKYSAQLSAAGTPNPVDSMSMGSFNPANLGPGAMIGRWEVIRRLGSGGMADVYLAHSRGEAGFEKLVAIKVMHSHLARNQRAVDHFLDEARLAARVHHPNVIAIQDLGKIGNDYVIVMDYVEGVDLERLLASARAGGRPVPLDVGLGILCRICDGLNGAHRATGPDGTPLGIIHRDVKSANVLVSRQGQVKVVDFGIAKATNQVHMTIAGETKGTPSMMAPEQRVGEQVDVRVDVYSVAAVGFEIVTGHAVNLDLAALAHLGVENWPHLPLPSSLRAGIPQELDDILLSAMSFERERRPADCAAFEAIFERVMKKHGLSCSDKDIARWVESELSQLVPAFQGVGSVISRPAGAS